MSVCLAKISVISNTHLTHRFLLLQLIFFFREPQNFLLIFYVSSKVHILRNLVCFMRSDPGCSSFFAYLLF